MDALARQVGEIVEKALEGNGLPDADIELLYGIDSRSKESYYIQWAGQTLSMQAADGKAEVHAQIGLNGSPCPKNCKFCSFAACNGIRKGKLEMPKQDVIEYAQAYEEAGANLILLLTTASYRFETLCEMAQTVREVISPEMPLLVNTGDLAEEQYRQLKELGVNGAYHAVRMREGIDTGIPIEDRLASIVHMQNVGMSISTCVEPVGPEHTPAELARETRRCIGFNPVSGGVGRRTAVPGTAFADKGMFDYAHMAHLVAVYRLASGLAPRLNCSAHATVAANAGGNLAWAEVGTNPRDTSERTERGGRGQSVAFARKVFRDSDWELLEGPSQGWML